MSTILLPSYPAPSYDELHRVLTRLKGVAPGFQIDIVDGLFAAPASWPQTELSLAHELQKLVPWQTAYRFEFDLMVENPLSYIDTLLSVSPARITFHFKSLAQMKPVLTIALQQTYKVDVAFVNDTPLTEVLQLRELYPAIGVQIMGIKEVGQQGQPFDKRTLDRVRVLRSADPELEITIDGAVNVDTLPLLYAAGANRFAPGSAITKAGDPVLAYKQLRSYLV